METVQTQLTTAFDALKEQFGYTNVNQTPTVEKVVVSVELLHRSVEVEIEGWALERVP